jgi:hypothetical protein
MLGLARNYRPISGDLDHEGETGGVTKPCRMSPQVRSYHKNQRDLVLVTNTSYLLPIGHQQKATQHFPHIISLSPELT